LADGSYFLGVCCHVGACSLCLLTDGRQLLQAELRIGQPAYSVEAMQQTKPLQLTLGADNPNVMMDGRQLLYAELHVGQPAHTAVWQCQSNAYDQFCNVLTGL
jgi:hypothetical protein